MTAPTEEGRATHRCAAGVVVHDPSTDELRDDTEWPLEDGRVLRLRLARGVIVTTDTSTQREQGEA